MKAVEVQVYCKCGGAMKARVAGSGPTKTKNVLLDLWSEVHSEPNCAPASKEEAAAARRREKRATLKQ